MQRAIRSWLKAGVMEGPDLFPTPQGTPQGGVISPLLANIALHGLETSIVASYPVGKKPTVVRYADDFVVMHSDVGVIREIQQRANTWLSSVGLELKPSKTQIVHTLEAHEGKTGFDFLGFEVRQHRVGKNRSGKNAQGRPLGFKTIIRPSKEGQRRHLEAIKEVVKANRDAPQEALVSRLNPVIRGWTNYYSSVASNATFERMDTGTYLKLRRWANRRHPRKNKAWVAHKYWRLETGAWIFGTKEGIKLYRHSRTPIRRHAKVRGTKSPYDGDWVYWATRMGKHPELPRRVATLLSWQKGRCTRCGLYFKTEDLPEVDHIIPSENGGRDGYINWQLLHRHCHDAKTAEDQLASVIGTHAKGQTVEEPDEAKASRPVL